MKPGVIIPRTEFEGPTFPKCGHPKTPENSYTRPDSGKRCAFCQRVRAMSLVVMERGKPKRLTVGQRIVRGLI